MSTIAQAESSKSASTHSMSVCILDDDADMVRVLQKTVEQFGFVTVGTSDPRNALEQIASGRSRVILCDMETPQIDGFTFLQQALQRDPASLLS